MDQLYGPFRGKFDYIVQICPKFAHNKTYHRIGETDPRMFVIECKQQEVEAWLKLVSFLFEGTNTLFILYDCARIPHVVIMADGLVSTSSDNSSLENTNAELFSIKHDGPELENLLLKGERLIWTSDLETLKKFVEETIQQHGKWSSPGGATKTFKCDNNRLTITWYRGKQSTLAFQGKDGPLLKEQLVNLIQRNKAQKPIDDSDSLSPNSTALQSGGQGPLVTDRHGCQTGALLDDSIVDSCDSLMSVAKGCSRGSKSLPSVPEVTYNDKQQVMAAGEGSGLDNCDCKGLSRELSAEMEGIKLDLVILQKQVEANTRSLSSNWQSEETIINEELQPLELTRLRNENRALRQRLSDLENSYESLKREARSVLDENKSLVTALRLLNNEIDKGNKHAIQETNKDNLHTDDRPSWEVDGTTLTANNRFSVLSNCETVDEENVTTNATTLTTNNRLAVQNNCETVDKENELTRSQPKRGGKSRAQPESVLIIGDSLIKNIDAQKLTKKTVDKRMYPGKTSDQICHEVDSIHIDVEPSYVIIHSGTNNLPSDSVESCVSKTENLALKIRNKFQTPKIGISSLTHREDISVSTKLSEVNEKLKEMSNRNGFHFIDNSHIDGSCLNSSKLHLNSKGSAYLATSFIKFLRPSANKARRPQGFHAPLRQLGQLIMQLASGPMRAPVHRKPRR